MPSKPRRNVLPSATEGDTCMVYPFSEEEYRKEVALLKKTKKTLADVLVEKLKNIGPRAQLVLSCNAQQMLH